MLARELWSAAHESQDTAEAEARGTASRGSGARRAASNLSAGCDPAEGLASPRGRHDSDP